MGLVVVQFIENGHPPSKTSARKLLPYACTSASGKRLRIKLIGILNLPYASIFLHIPQVITSALLQELYTR